MVDASVDELNLRVRVKTPQQIAQALARSFEHLLRVASLLLEDYIPKGVRAVSGLRGMRAGLAYVVDQLDVSQLQALGGNLPDFVHEVADNLLLHAINALSNYTIDGDAGSLVHLARLPKQVYHLLRQALRLRKQAKHILGPLQDLLVIILAGKDNFKSLEADEVLHDLLLFAQ